MLFPYQYVPHKMEKMQEFIDFIFFDVWCKAPSEAYGIHLFESFDPLYQIMGELYRLDLAGTLTDGSGKWFYESVNEIFIQFKQLDGAEIRGYCQSYQANNFIEELCLNKHAISPVQYRDLNPSKADLNNKLGEFFKKLYSSGFFGLSFVKKALGSDLTSYYVDFVRVNNFGCCPFCGLLPIDNEFDPTREAFDHYLPKSKYPFNSVNLKNLAPSCYKCNSGNKRDKDPLHDADNNRRKAFYPFSATTPDIALSVSIQYKHWSPLTPEKLSIIFDSTSHSEEISTWKDLFRIEERYLARCCDTGGGLYWLNRVLNERHNYNLSVQDMLDAEIKSAGKDPWAESNFLKKAFLEGCKRAGLFDNIA